jgi:EpsI family protein
MISRRDLIIGGTCLAAAASAEAIRPNERLDLLGNQKLEDRIPRSFGVWRTQEGGGVVAPQSEDGLAARLYNQTVARTYVGPDEQLIMLLIAYGNTQSDTLQLHRPEVCYPAFGFKVTDSRPTLLKVSNGASIPGRSLTAQTEGRLERISYWTRIGEYLPVDESEQRKMRFRTALAGIIPDGVLVRISNVVPDEAEAFALNGRFASDFLQAVPASLRPALVTTSKARQISGPVMSDA